MKRKSKPWMTREECLARIDLGKPEPHHVAAYALFLRSLRNREAAVVEVAPAPRRVARHPHEAA